MYVSPGISLCLGTGCLGKISTWRDDMSQGKKLAGAIRPLAVYLRLRYNYFDGSGPEPAKVAGFFFVIKCRLVTAPANRAGAWLELPLHTAAIACWPDLIAYSNQNIVLYKNNESSWKMTKATLHAKHQITLPSEIVRQLKLREGDELLITVEDSCAILRPLRSTYRGALKDDFKSHSDIAAFLRSERESWRG
jgi:AbrB family looped-hinge helix DNA binding protein